jgi:hypothetical protein
MLYIFEISSCFGSMVLIVCSQQSTVLGNVKPSYVGPPAQHMSNIGA